jgi:hypothetical protein
MHTGTKGFLSFDKNVTELTRTMNNKIQRNMNSKQRRNNNRARKFQAQPKIKRSLKIDRPNVPNYSGIQNAKWNVFARSVVNPTTAPTIVRFSPLVSQGLATNNRIGDKIMLTNLEIKYSITAADQYNLVRVILIRVIGVGNGIATTMGDFYDNGPSGVPDVYSMSYPYLQKATYQVLADNTDVVCAQSPNLTVFREFGIPMNFTIDYQYSTTTSRNGELVLIYLSDSSIAPNPQLNLNAVVWFRDL